HIGSECPEGGSTLRLAVEPPFDIHNRVRHDHPRHDEPPLRAPEGRGGMPTLSMGVSMLPRRLEGNKREGITSGRWCRSRRRGVARGSTQPEDEPHACLTARHSDDAGASHFDRPRSPSRMPRAQVTTYSTGRAMMTQ